MPEQNRESSSDPRFHTAKLREMLTQIIEHARSDVRKISDPKAQALFETTAKVLFGLRKALEDFERGNEEAWKRAS